LDRGNAGEGQRWILDVFVFSPALSHSHSVGLAMPRAATYLLIKASLGNAGEGERWKLNVFVFSPALSHSHSVSLAMPCAATYLLIKASLHPFFSWSFFLS